MNQLYFATGNQDKLREVGQILGIELKQIKLDLDEIQAINVEDLIEHKAKQAYELSGKKMVLVEDTGLYFEAWKGLPGALIKWFLKTVDCGGICKMMENETNRAARAQCIFAFYDGKKVSQFSGEVKGSISQNPIGEHGFGWDKIFVPEGYSQTFSQMISEEKNKISHRKKALNKLKKYLIVNLSN